MKKTLLQFKAEKYVILLRRGDERGLSFVYRQCYRYLLYRAHKATKDYGVAESLTQEALFKLWLLRREMKCMEDIWAFLKKQIGTGVDTFYGRLTNRFHRNLLRLDDIEDYQDFLAGYEVAKEEEEDLVYLEGLDEEKQRRLKKINNLLPSLTQQQQLFIKLCLKFSFNFDRETRLLEGRKISKKL